MSILDFSVEHNFPPEKLLSFIDTWSPAIGPTGVLAFLRLASAADENGLTNLSVPDLAVAISTSYSSAERAFRRLREVGLVETLAAEWPGSRAKVKRVENISLVTTRSPFNMTGLMEQGQLEIALDEVEA